MATVVKFPKRYRGKPSPPGRENTVSEYDWQEQFRKAFGEYTVPELPRKFPRSVFDEIETRKLHTAKGLFVVCLIATVAFYGGVVGVLSGATVNILLFSSAVAVVVLIVTMLLAPLRWRL